MQKQTKYVMNNSGQVVIANERTGIQHYPLSLRFLDGSKAISAGFVYLDDNDRFAVYGRSIGLGIGCNPFAADALNDAFRDGTLVIFPTDDEDHEFWLAGNFPHPDGEVVTDVNELVTKQIILY